MKRSAFILTPTSMAEQLTSITGRVVPLKSIPKASVGGKPLAVDTSVPGAFGNAKRESLRAAVAAFNAG